MTDDVLGKFRHPNAALPTAKPESPQRSTEALPAYDAFKAANKAKALDVRRVMGASHTPSYIYLLDVVYDRDFATEIVLVYSFLMVKIKGRNLQTLILALQNRECAFIQEYDPRAFTEPLPSEPLIESIEVINQQG